MLPKSPPTKNRVSQFVDDLFESHFHGVPEIQMLRDIAVSITNDDPNRVVEFLVKLHNEIGDFVMRWLQELDGEEESEEIDGDSTD